MSGPLLYHYTCSHGREGIGDRGVLLSTLQQLPRQRRAQLPPAARFVWLTDLDEAARHKLGLTSYMLTCDRTVHRYRVVDTSNCLHWSDLQRDGDKALMLSFDGLALAPGTAPEHWWASRGPVQVVYDPDLRRLW